MAFFNHLSQCGGELRREGGVLLKARLSEWERELQYLRFRIAEWKQFGSADHPDYKGFRSFLLQKVSDHLRFELKVRSFRPRMVRRPLLIPPPLTNVRTYMRHTDILDDFDGMRSRGGKRRRASAAGLHR